MDTIQILVLACQDLNISYEIVHQHQRLLRIRLGDNFYYFVNQSTPFNCQSISNLSKDKEYIYSLLQDKINMPFTIGFINPFCEENFQKYLKYYSLADIEAEITGSFQLPVIIKRNSGTGGSNIFLCPDINQIQGFLETIFNVNSKDFDKIALAQEFLEIDREFRAIFFQGKLVLLYEKDISNARFVGNLSPLHWEGGKAKHITNQDLIAKIESFAQPIFSEIPISYTGLDIIIDKSGKYWLLEINSSPGYKAFLQDNDYTILVDMFKDILSQWGNIC